MAQFYYEEYVQNYEVDYHNELTIDEKDKLSKKLGISVEYISHCFFKTYDGWSYRISGMTYNIKGEDWYPIIKEHLDKEFLKFMRKEKLKQIDGI